MRAEQLVMEKLEKIEKEIVQLKKTKVDADSVMTEDDYAALLGYRKEKAQRKLVSHEKIKKELGL